MKKNLMAVIGESDTSQFDPKQMWIGGDAPYECLERAEREHVLKEICINNFLTTSASIMQESTLLTVHSSEYITFLKQATGWQSKTACKYVQQSDNYALTSDACFNASLQAASNAICGAQILSKNDAQHVYALSRPPGHHAGIDKMGGTCYVNNAALAAINLRDKGKKVAVLDIDRHAGNGTYDILLNEEGVLFSTIHVENAYPWNAYYNKTRNNCIAVPINQDSSAESYIDKLRSVLDNITAYSPDMLVISLGLDISSQDIIELEENGSFGIGSEGFHEIGSLVSSMNIPTLSIQEGGYNIKYLPINLYSYLSGISDK